MTAATTLAEMEARVAVFVDWKYDGLITWRAPDGCGYFNPPSYASDLNLWPAIHVRLDELSDLADQHSLEERFDVALADVIADDHRSNDDEARGYNLGRAMVAASAEQRLRALCSVLETQP